MIKILGLFVSVVSVVYGVDIEPTLIRGEEVPEGALPQVVAIRSSGAGCSATLVGERILITAAHCASTGAKVTTVIDGKPYVGTAKRHPSYPRTDIDVAIVKLSAPVPGVNPMHVHEDQVVVGEEVTLTGYGCTKEDGVDGEFGTLRYGTAVVTGRSGYDLMTNSGAAACFGDSGSGVFKDNQIVAVVSKGDISQRSLTLELHKVKSWLLSTGESICGISSAC